ncbi:MAG: endonuclease III [Actinobacteria bacterium]|nr:endonuclease III [Actinomycetota bacterium]
MLKRLAKQYPGSAVQLCALVHRSPFELLVATILSAQCTDKRVNQVTPAFFKKYPDPSALSRASLKDVEEMVHSTGFYKAKAANLVAMSQALISNFGGEVPKTLSELTTLAGVGRKTANVIRSVAFGLGGIAVDTHVGRVSRRLGLTTNMNPDIIGEELEAIVPPGQQGSFSLRLILHGRQVCKARKPLCDVCILADMCPSSKALP